MIYIHTYVRDGTCQVWHYYSIGTKVAKNTNVNTCQDYSS